MPHPSVHSPRWWCSWRDRLAFNRTAHHFPWGQSNSSTERYARRLKWGPDRGEYAAPARSRPGGISAPSSMGGIRGGDACRPVGAPGGPVATALKGPLDGALGVSIGRVGGGMSRMGWWIRQPWQSERRWVAELAPLRHWWCGP